MKKPSIEELCIGINLDGISSHSYTKIPPPYSSRSTTVSKIYLEFPRLHRKSLFEVKVALWLFGTR